MGASCQCCADKPNKLQPVSSVPVSSSQGSKEQSPRVGGKKRDKGTPLAPHEGQTRAALQIKEGGFSLKSFAATNPGSIDQFYKLSKNVVGEGAFGKVVVAWDLGTNRPRAVKSIQKSNAKECQVALEEIHIISLLDHPNIVRIYESFQDKRSIYLVMELCDGGELFERIVEMGCLTEAAAAHCVKQMLLAVNYLHQNLIVHRDLKPENWLVATKEPVQNSSLKLIDFGISKRFKPGEIVTSKAGTPNYVAPEVITGRYGEKIDIWSTGVIMYIMLTGAQPFNGKSVEEILQAVQRSKVSYDGKPWRSISDVAKGLNKMLLQRAVSVRPSASSALQHPWFTKMADPKDEEYLLTKLDIENLRTFSQFSKVKKAALTVVASQLSDSRIDKLKNLFMNIDKNSDGTLSILELKQGLKAAGVKIPKDLATVLEQVDTDGSGVLDYTEFLAATMDAKMYSQESIVWAAFRKFDRDGSGTIDKTELFKVLGDETLKDELAMFGDTSEMQRIFEEIDINGDGVIDFEEFFAMVRVAEDGARDTVVENHEAVPSGAPSANNSARSKGTCGSTRSPKLSKGSGSTKASRKASKDSSRSPRNGASIGIGKISSSN